MPRRSARDSRRSASTQRVPQGRGAIDFGRVDQLIEAGQFAEAEVLLDDLAIRHPNQPEILGRKFAVLAEQGELLEASVIGDHLAALMPDEPGIQFALTGVYLGAGYVFLGDEMLRQLLKRWPGHELANELRGQLMSLEPLLEELRDDFGLTGAQRQELPLQFERVQMLMDRDDLREAIRQAEATLQRWPDFDALRDILSVAQFRSGMIQQAIQSAREVLDKKPDSLEACANLARFLYFQGSSEAQGALAQLKAIVPGEPEMALKQAETSSFFGDDLGVLDVFELAQKHLKDADPPVSAMLHHLAAVASWRLGKTAAAKRHWNKALDLDPELDLAADNLMDLELPVDERNIAWAYSIGDWIRPEVIEAFERDILGSRNQSEEALADAANRLLKRHPEVETIVPALFDRGDPDSREFALMVAALARTPALIDALRTFGLGQRGPTELRLQAVQIAQQAGLIPHGLVRFWMKGKWNDLMLIGFEIYTEAVEYPRPGRAQELAEQASDALSRSDAVTAERLLREGIALSPDDPALQNNLAVAIGRQGREDEALSIVEAIHARHPDYLFARTTLAVRAAKAGRFDDAKALLDPMLRLDRIHISEFHSLMNAQLEFYTAQGNYEAARGWLSIWRQIEPESDDALMWELQLPREEPAKSKRGRKRK
jgi:tetratricopeptide (TPR) repeat protein